MKQNTLEKLFKEFSSNKISYCVRGRYKHLPKTLDKGDVDILIEKEDFSRARKIIKGLGFLFYPFTHPNIFYYYHDFNLGLIQLDILVTSKFPQIKKHKNFFIPKNEKPIGNKKTLLEKIKTFAHRKIHYFFNGKVIAFVGPDGSGKSSNVSALYNALEKLPIKKEIIHFSTKFKTKKPSALKRLVTRSQSILKTYLNIALGRLTITDRYIYLTFRNSNPLLMRLLRFLSPTPDLIYVAKASPYAIRKRKKGQRDRLSVRVIKELYEHYKKIPNARIIDTEIPLKQNTHYLVNEVLKKILIS